MIEGTNQMVGGFFSHRVLIASAIEKPIEQLQKRLSYMIQYHKLEGGKAYKSVSLLDA